MEYTAEAIKAVASQLLTLYESTLLISSTLNLDTVLRFVTEQITLIIGMDACFLFDWDRAGQKVEIIAEYLRDGVQRPPGAERSCRLPKHPALLGVLRSGSPLVVRLDDPAGDEKERAMLKEWGMKTLLILPLWVKGRSIGLAKLQSFRDRSFSELEIQLGQTLVNQVAIAIENARLFEQVKESEERYESLFEDSIDPIVTADMQGHITDANQKACELLGCSKEELMKMSVSAFKLSEPFYKALPEIRSGKEIKIEVEVTSKTGKKVPVELRISKIQYKGKIFYQAIGRDISERRALEKMREDFIHMLVHDLRNPLSAIRLSLEMLQTRCKQEGVLESVSKFLDMALHSSRQMLDLIDSILDLSKLEANQMTLEMRPAVLSGMIEQALAQVSPLATEEGIILKADLPPHIPFVKADEEKILRVLVNLLDNALKFTPRGGTIGIKVTMLEEEPNYVSVSVSDQGPGIPLEYQDKIFEKFCQVKGQVGRKKGTGLGLPFCKLMVEAHGGRIWVESEEGKGATFTFTLPVTTLEIGE